jgi:hypothetical protein
MNDLNNTLVNVNQVLSGERSIQVDARVPNMELAKVSAVLFVTIFLAVALANKISG